VHLPSRKNYFLLTLQKLQCRRGERELFSDVDVALQRGELLQVEGANGSGKTSLLRIVAGLSAAASGEIRWNNETIDELAEDYFRDLLYLGHAAAIKDELTALENLHLTLQLAGERSSPGNAKQALSDAGLKDRLHLPAKYLSQGQRRRVALARLCLSERPLWILDEPFTALDVGAISWVAQLIANQLKRNGIVLFTTHQDVPIPGFVPRKLKLNS
jgi:heme exporter protein A